MPEGASAGPVLDDRGDQEHAAGEHSPHEGVLGAPPPRERDEDLDRAAGDGEHCAVGARHGRSMPRTASPDPALAYARERTRSELVVDGPELWICPGPDRSSSDQGRHPARTKRQASRSFSDGRSSMASEWATRRRFNGSAAMRSIDRAAASLGVVFDRTSGGVRTLS